MNHFQELVKHAQEEDYFLLRLATLGNHMGAMNSSKGTTEQVEVPWTIAFFLKRFSRKHILCGTHSLNIERTVEGLRNFEESLKWRAHMRASGLPTTTHRWSSLRVSRPVCRRFVGIVPAPLKLWCGELRSQVVQASHRAESHWRSNADFKARHVTLNGITKLAMKQLESSMWVPIENDKDPGWTLVERSEFDREHCKILEQKQYMCIGGLPTTIWEDFHTRVRRVARLEQDNRLLKVLNSAATAKGARIHNFLGLTVKSHKQQGSVNFRDLHLSSSYAFAGLGRWLHRRLDQELQERAPHLLRAPTDTTKTIKGLYVPDGYKLFRFDSKSFFMSGDVYELGEWALKVLPKGYREKVAKGVAHFLLSNQYIQKKGDDLMFRLIEGTGMGLPQSGALADSALFMAAEDGYVNNHSRLAEGEILLWTRSRDDILMIAKPGKNMRRFYFDFKARARRFYEVECVEVGGEATFLQTVLRIHHNRILVRPKPPPARPPLSTMSCHP